MKIVTIKPTPQQIQQELWTNQIIQSSSKSQAPPLFQRTAQHSAISRTTETEEIKNQSNTQKVKTEKITPYVAQELIVTPRPRYNSLDIGEEQKVSYIISNSGTTTINTSLIQQLKTEPEELFNYY